MDAGQAVGGEVIYHTSFEDSDPDWLSRSTTYDTSQHHSGTQSLKYTRLLGIDYVLASVSIPVRPDATYLLGEVYAKTAGLAGPPSGGARLALEGYDAQGNYVDGAYSTVVRSEDWSKATLAYEVRPNVSTWRLSLYLPRDVTGTVWFDDLTVMLEPPPVLISELLAPSYRGQLIPGDHDQVSLRVRVGLDEAELAAHSVTTSIIDEAGTIVDEQKVPAGAIVDYNHDAGALAAGRYTVRTLLTVNASGASAGGDEWGIEKLSGDAPQDYIDRHGRLIKNGEPFFPLGFYNNDIDSLTIQQLSGTPFNTVLPYTPLDEERLDLAAAHGLNIIYSIKDFFYDSTAFAKPAEIVTEADEVPYIIQTVERYRDHPALLAWYLNDELPIRRFRDRLISHYDAVVQHDVRHPAYTVHYGSPYPPGDYMRTLDAFGADPYPIHGDSADDISACTVRAKPAAQALPGRAIWHVPQSFAWGTFDGFEGRFPTLSEFRNMTWQFVITGATGLVYFHLNNMRQDPDLTFEQAMEIASTAGQEVSNMTAAILSVDDAPETTASGGDWLTWTVRSHDSDGYLFAVNLTTDSQTATFTMAAAMSVEVIDEGRSLPVDAEGSFTDTFASIDTHRYRILVPAYGSLEALTISYFSESTAPGAQGAANAAVQILEQAREASARGDDSAEQGQLNAYRKELLRAGTRHLSPARGQTLARLSHHVRSESTVR